MISLPLKNCRKINTFRSMMYGFYGGASPAVIIKNISRNQVGTLHNTPYQAEISQGRLED